MATIELLGKAEPCSQPAERTLFDIVSNCVSTIIICAWVSVHPNVPPSGYWKGLWGRVQTMFWTIIAPELILAWAVRQWYGAWEIKDTVNGSEESLFAGLKRTVEGWFCQRTPLVSSRWTMAHGHLLGMGGISTVDPSLEDYEVDTRGSPVTIDRYRELIKTDKAHALKRQLMRIREVDIQDRSKGDLLSKLIAILQTTWFILQCIARGQQRLALTELELVTLALASLNTIMYVFWWRKPLGVQEPIRIYIETEGLPVDLDVDEHADVAPEFSASSLVSKIGEIFLDLLPDFLNTFKKHWNEGSYVELILSLTNFFFILYYLAVACLFLPFPLGIILLLRILKTKPVAEQSFSDTRGLIIARILLFLRKLRYQFTSYISRVSERWLKEFLDASSLFALLGGWFLIVPALFFFLLATTILLLPFFTLLFLVSFIFTAVFGIINSNTVPPNSAHVPSFYAPRTKSDKYSRMVVFAVFGIVFGGLHCIGWNFTYPTTFERQLWRLSSLAITLIPLIVAPIDCLLENCRLDRGFLKVLRLSLDLIMTVLLFIYVPARLTLIAQSLASLRKLPPSAFLSVDWNQYIPHVF